MSKLLTDESYIKLTLEIARKGAGKVSPNPLVGCVIVKDNKIIGAGYHEQYGHTHAEVNALDSAVEPVEGASLYVNLEPCCHYGNTPPCVDRIIESKIRKVVIGTLDVNPVVAGKGVKKLKQAGIEVTTGVLEDECAELNKFFFKFMTKKMPYVTLKAATTLDGKIADAKGRSRWISSLSSRRYVHELRSAYDAVLVGTNTIKKDDPKLNVRLVEGRNPKRIILDPRLNISLDHNVYSDNNAILLVSEDSFNKKKRTIEQINKMGIDIIPCDIAENNKFNIKNILKRLAKKNITSILVEGGSRVYTSFIQQEMFDNLLVFISPKILGDGISIVSKFGIGDIKNSYKLKVKSFEKIGDDLLIDFVKN